MRQLVPVRTVPPGVDLLEISDARKQCNLDHTEHDEHLKALVASVTGALEAPAGILRICLNKQTWRDAWSAFPSTCRIRLSVEPLISVSAVEYIAAGATSWTAFSSDYWAAYTDAEGGWVELLDDATWPDTAKRPEAVRVTYVAGHNRPADIPQAVLHAARLMVAHYYENREASVIGVPAQDLPLGVRNLVGPFLRVPT